MNIANTAACFMAATFAFGIALERAWPGGVFRPRTWFMFGLMWVIIGLLLVRPAAAFGPIPKKDQCISVNAMIQRNCAPVYMCNGTPETNASWCCSARWADEEVRLLRWYKRNCEK